MLTLSDDGCRAIGHRAALHDGFAASQESLNVPLLKPFSQFIALVLAAC